MFAGVLQDLAPTSNQDDFFALLDADLQLKFDDTANALHSRTEQGFQRELAIRVKEAEDRASEVAKQTHAARLARETELCDEIAKLKRLLKVQLKTSR